MRLLCSHCNTLSDQDQYEIRASAGKFYGGGAVYKAIHKRCHKVMYLTAQMVSALKQRRGSRV
jgi:hypothetical protein